MNIAKKLSTYLYLYLFVLVVYTLIVYTVFQDTSMIVLKPVGITFGFVLHITIVIATVKTINREVKHRFARNVLSVSSFAFYTFILIQTLSYKIYFIN